MRFIAHQVHTCAHYFSDEDRYVRWGGLSSLCAGSWVEPEHFPDLHVARGRSSCARCSSIAKRSPSLLLRELVTR